MAGIDKDFNGQTILSEGYTIGFLEQEPLVDCTKTVREVVEEGVQETVDLLKEFEAINAAFADPDADMEQLCERQAVVQDKLDALDAWELDSRLDLAMDALRCPPGDTKVAVLSGGEKRRVALCRLLLQKPDILLLDEPTNHLDAETVGWLEQHLQRYEGRSSPSPTTVTSSTTSPGGSSSSTAATAFPGKATIPPGWSRSRSACAARRRPRASGRKRCSTNWNGCACHQGPSCQGPGAHQRLRKAPQPGGRPARARTGAVYSARAAPRRGGHRGFRGGQRVRRPAPLRQPELQPPPGGIVGIIGPNGAGKTTLFRMITGQEQPDAGSFKIGETVKLAYADQERGLDPDKTLWEEITGGQEQIALGKQLVNSRGYVARFNFSGSDQQKKVGVLSVVSATACTWPRCCARRPTSCSSTSRPTTSTSTPCAPSRRVGKLRRLRGGDQPRPLVP